MKEGERLKEFIENQPKSKISIARDLNISKQTLFQYFKSKELTGEIKDRFEGYFGKKIFGTVSMTTDQQQERPQQERPQEESITMQTILKLAASNQTLSDANKKLADAHFLLAEGNRELVRMATVNAPPQNEQAVNAMRSAFLELLGQVGSGKRFHSPDELKTVYNKLVSDTLVPKGEGDTQKNSDRKHTVK